MLKTLYKGVATALSPILKHVYLKHFLRSGEGDPSRLPERWGVPSQLRPEGDLIWFHAASVGEVVSLRPVLKRFQEEFKNLNVLVTTGTLTSAKVIAPHLPDSYIHQLIPLDVPQWVDRFLEYWHPKAGIFIESDLWPNLLFSCKEKQVPLLLLNAHVSTQSYHRWQKVPTFAKSVLGCIDEALAKSPAIAENLRRLGVPKVRASGNLKFMADPLTYDADTFQMLQGRIAGRPVWVAASTHAGEEEQIAQAHRLIKKTLKNVLTILVPRHPHRGAKVCTLLRKEGLNVAQRSNSEPIQEGTDIYLADTIGELGLFYKISEIAFIGGSFVPESLILVGGHNPIEAAKLGCAMIWGPNIHKQLEIAEVLGPAIQSVQNPSELADVVVDLFQNKEKRSQQIHKAQEILDSQANTLDEVLTAVRAHIGCP